MLSPAIAEDNVVAIEAEATARPDAVIPSMVEPTEGMDGSLPPDLQAPPLTVNVPPPTPPTEEGVKDINAIRLQGLNKVTARISTLSGPLGTVMRFGNIEIIAHRCWKAPPDQQPENAALLEIRELHANESPQIIFQGWMFSSSPALSALEHAVYDITVLACEHEDTSKE